jgi:hypothetical protein
MCPCLPQAVFSYTQGSSNCARFHWGGAGENREGFSVHPVAPSTVQRIGHPGGSARTCRHAGPSDWVTARPLTLLVMIDRVSSRRNAERCDCGGHPRHTPLHELTGVFRSEPLDPTAVRRMEPTAVQQVGFTSDFEFWEPICVKARERAPRRRWLNRSQSTGHLLKNQRLAHPTVRYQT